MKVAFRTDASLLMGSGHVMRCLTLAETLRVQGADCHFISRAHPGHLLDTIRQRGFTVAVLPQEPTQALGDHPLAHASWLGCHWQTDAQQATALLNPLQPDWLVVDHYALDLRWEQAVAPHYQKLMVIDDLADRPHHSDLLLDQNLGRQPQDYDGLVPAYCQVLTGPQYALLRPEFAALRPYSLRRRQEQTSIGRLLITMGGVDQDNATGQVLQALKTCTLPADCRITVVMGLTAPWLQNVRELAAQMPWTTEVVVNVNDMAQRMADSDLAIGAAGSTSWERCCLGLPTLMVVLAGNQISAAKNIQNAGAANCFTFNGILKQNLQTQVQSLVQTPTKLSQISNCASAVTDGLGTARVVATMKSLELT